MSRLILVALLGLLSACMTLPGSDTTVASRYSLPVGDSECSAGGSPLALRVPRVNVGLDSDRIARRDARSGEITLPGGCALGGRSGLMVEQRLARDLECHGFTVMSSHHQKLGQPQLVCEVRAFNLMYSEGRDSAEVGLSCMYYAVGDAADRPFVTMQQSRLDQWSAPSAVAAIGEAYELAFDELRAALR